MLLADRLAGIDAVRYARYVDAVDRFEDRWQAFVTPRIMSYRGVTAEDLTRLPKFTQKEAVHINSMASKGPALWWLLAACMALGAVMTFSRAGLARP
jgi:ABC-2 type transport system permease protein